MNGRGDGTDEDALWQSIVANYGDRVSLEPDEPAAPDQSDETRPRPEPAPRTEPAPRSEPVPMDPWVERHLAEEHYVPPEPPATSLPEPRRLLAWVGVLGVPVALVLLVVLQVAVPQWGSLLMMVWFLGGFVFLVATMRRGDDDDDHDDGAVV